MNDSALPSSYITRCNNLLETIEIDADKVLKIIRSLDRDKAHGWDDMSVSIVKICDSSIVQPLCSSYETCMHTGVFPDNWKKTNVLPIHRKESMQLKKKTTTDRYHYCLSVVRSLGKLFLTPCIDILLTINS